MIILYLAIYDYNYQPKCFHWVASASGQSMLVRNSNLTQNRVDKMTRLESLSAAMDGESIYYPARLIVHDFRRLAMNDFQSEDT